MYFENRIETGSNKIYFTPFMRNQYEEISDIEREEFKQLFKDRGHELYKFF